MRSDGWEVNTWQGREKEGMGTGMCGKGREQICSKYQLDRYIMSSLWSLRSSGRIRCLDTTSTFRRTCETSQPGAQTGGLDVGLCPASGMIVTVTVTVNHLKNDVQLVTQLPQSRRQVHDVLSAAESVRPIADSEVTCGPMTRPTTLSSSATSSSSSTDFSSSSSSSKPLKLWCMVQEFSKDQMSELDHHCLAHLFTYQPFVDPPGSSSYVYGLAYIGSPHYGVGVCHSGMYTHTHTHTHTHTRLTALFPGLPG